MLNFLRNSLLIGIIFVCGSALNVQARTKEQFTDVVEATMAGEYALQAGKLDEALTWYLKAAENSEGDAGLAERAARIALLTNNEKQTEKALKLWRQRAPDSIALKGAEATLLLRENKQRPAVKALEELMRSEDPNGWRQALGALTVGAKDPKVSAKVLRKLVDRGAIPNDLRTWLVFGGLAQRLGDSELAERIVSQVIKRFPGEPRVALLRASQARLEGNNQDAKKILDSIVAGKDLTQELRVLIASEYDMAGFPKSAADVIASGDQSASTQRLRAALLAKAEDKQELGRYYEELKKDANKPNPEQRLLLAQVAEFLERYEEALEWYRSVPAGEAKLMARMRAAKVLSDLKRPQDAYAELKSMQSDSAIDEDARRDAYLMEAELRNLNNDIEGEKDVYARALAAYPDDNAVLYARSLMWERVDDIPRAEADLRKVLVSEPDNVAALNALGYTLADRTTRYKEALELIDRARVAEPNSAAIVDSYGWVLYRLKRYDEALVHLRRAYTLEKDPEIAAHIGEVLWVTGQKEEAAKFFRESQKLKPDNRSLKRALEVTGAKL